MATDSREWTVFAWRGFRMEVPMDWELGAFDGDDTSGYVRLDDLYRPRLEIRYSKYGKRDNIEQTAKHYLDSINKTVGKKKLPIERQPRPLNLEVAWPEDLQMRSYRYRGQMECVATVLQCSSCHRMSVVQIFFPAGSYSAGICKRIFGSLHDHNLPQAAYWDFYLLHVRAATSWQLTGHKFNPGYAELNFFGPDKLQVDFRRWGPASVILQNKSLEDWAAENWPAGMKPDSIVAHNRPADVARVTRRNGSGFLGPVQRLLGRGTAIRKALFWESTFWHCPKSERLWMVDVFARTGSEVSQAPWQVLCHQEVTV